MAERYNFIEKSTNNTTLSEMITVTISLAEYRSLVAENEALRHEADSLRYERDRAIEEKNNIKEQWENEKKWWKEKNTMTDNDIIKALECCTRDYCHTSECPVFNGTTSEDCRNELIKSALDLINRLQERKEHYKNNRNEYQDKVMFISKQCDELQEENSRQKAEIERLEKENAIVFSIPENTQFENLEHFETRQVSKEMLPTIVRRAKAEAITEFEKKAKEKAFLPLGTWCAERVITENDIDQIAKEMKEGVTDTNVGRKERGEQ